MRKKLKKITPNPEKIKNSKFLKPIAHLLTDPHIWYFNKRTIANGIAIGVLIGFLPIPFQMLLASIIAVISRVNLPIAVLTTWVSNPITIPFIFTANYYMGCWILQTNSKLKELDFTIESILNLGGEILKPLYLGSLIMGAIASAICFLVARGWWRISVIQNYRNRKTLKKHK